MRKDIIYHPAKGLALRDIETLLFDDGTLSLSAEAMEKVERCYAFLEAFVSDKVIYGINTGFGPMAQYRIGESSLKQLQYNIIRSHSTGAGQPLPPVYVKASMIARLVTLLQGYSGVHPEWVGQLLCFINRDICPFVPEHGSVGASGDLVQLAHIALALIGEGEAFYQGELRSVADILEAEQLQPLHVYIREGLSVTNGTSVMTGIGLINLIYTEKLLDWAVMASVMMTEITSSYDDHISFELNAVRRHNGQQQVAETMRRWIAGSRCIRKREDELFHKTEAEKFQHKVQPYYSLRCVPQILGPVWDELDSVRKMLIDELNSACDNPIVDPDSRNIYHGGNFHGDYVAFGMDKLKIAVTKLTMLAERQMNYLFHDRINEILPPFVNLGVPGLNYGMQAVQFTATSTTAECQMLSNPMYVHSIPNNNDNQDVVSMGTNAAWIAAKVIENSFQVMAIHFMALVQAIDCLKIQNELSEKTHVIYKEIRSFFPAFTEDAPKYKVIEQMKQYLINHAKIQ
ncbi:MAG: aromatic amino acid ammonia-lyase [Tannerella sp.]|jgi:histidine ammonia-lyase|nr:aromatic amino acid ammonia-lyase [Tannerella sp.]